jgi:hypothetical protein
MNERYLGTSPVETFVDHGAILKEQLESGKTDRFDAGSVALLRHIAERKDQSTILQRVIDTGIVGMKSFGSKVAGALGAHGAGVVGGAHAARTLSEYLSERFTLDPADVKAIPNTTAKAVEGAFGSVVEGIDPSIVQTSKETAGAVASFFNGVAGRAREFVVDSGGGDALKVGDRTLTAVTEAVSTGTSRGVDVAVESINSNLVQPTIDVTSDTVGTLSYLPSAAIGYMIASGIVGGTAGVVEQIRNESGFAHVSELITHSRESHMREHAEKDDPRVKLIAEFKRCAQPSENKKLKFTQAQWLLFAAETRNAKCSLLRAKIQAPEIVLDEEKTVIEKKQRIVDSIILNTQSGLAEADRELATLILAQFEQMVTQATDPIEAAHAQEQVLSKKILKYSQIFVRSGLTATGMPTLWRAFKRSARFAGKMILPI